MESSSLVDWDERSLRYSPRPLDDYYHFDSAAEKYVGYAYCFFDCQPGWNLYWLCEPGLDRFLDIRASHVPQAFAEAEKFLDRGLFHQCLLALGQDDRGGSPFLRSALALPPTRFMEVLEARLPLRRVSLFVARPGLSDLVGVMWQRARHAESFSRPPAATAGKVIVVDFRCRR